MSQVCSVNQTVKGICEILEWDLQQDKKASGSVAEFQLAKTMKQVSSALSPYWSFLDTRLHDVINEELSSIINNAFGLTSSPYACMVFCLFISFFLNQDCFPIFENPIEKINERLRETFNEL